MPKRNKLQLKEKRLQKKQLQLKSEQESEPQKPKNKIWKRVGLFDNYSDAVQHKEKVLSSIEDSTLAEIKIKRCGVGGEKFQVKLWSTSPKLSKKKLKKVRGE